MTDESLEQPHALKHVDSFATDSTVGSTPRDRLLAACDKLLFELDKKRDWEAETGYVANCNLTDEADVVRHALADFRTEGETACL